MKLVRIPILVFVFLCVVRLNSLSPLICQHCNFLGFSSNLVFMFFMFNTIIFAILVQGYGPSADEFDRLLPFLLSVYEAEEEKGEGTHHDNDNSYGDSVDSDDDDYYYYGSDGYEEDDDDNGSDDEVGWQDDEEENDDDLERRIEEFIAKVNKRWREEWLRDKFCNQVE